MRRAAARGDVRLELMAPAAEARLGWVRCARLHVPGASPHAVVGILLGTAAVTGRSGAPVPTASAAAAAVAAPEATASLHDGEAGCERSSQRGTDGSVPSPADAEKCYPSAAPALLLDGALLEAMHGAVEASGQGVLALDMTFGAGLLPTSAYGIVDAGGTSSRGDGGGGCGGSSDQAEGLAQGGPGTTGVWLVCSLDWAGRRAAGAAAARVAACLI